MASESHYFRAILSGDFIESKSRTVRVEDRFTDEDVKFMLQWLRDQNLREKESADNPDSAKKKVPIPVEFDEAGNPIDNDELDLCTTSWPLLISGWLLGEYCSLPNFQNHLMDIMCRRIKKASNNFGAKKKKGKTTAVEHERATIDPRIWTETTENSPLQILIKFVLAEPALQQAFHVANSEIPADQLKNALLAKGTGALHRRQKFEEITNRLVRVPSILRSKEQSILWEEMTWARAECERLMDRLTLLNQVKLAPGAFKVPTKTRNQARKEWRCRVMASVGYMGFHRWRCIIRHSDT
jgi:hypothetical protein